MEQTETIATPQVQGDAGVSFDANGEMQFTESGMKAFQDLLKEDVTDNTQRPTAEEKIEDTPEDEPEVTPKAKTETTKRKIKVGGQEIEVEPDQEVSLMQQGMDYTKKMQALAEKERGYAPYDALLGQLKTDPNLSKHIAEYWKPREPEAPKFEDPIEQLKWEIRQDVLNETRQIIQQTAAPIQRQQALNQVRQQMMADPDYSEVHGAIVEYVNSLPPTLQKSTYLQLDQDPASYVEFFQHYKTQLAGKKTKPKETTTTEGEVPKPVKRTEKAPILESSGNAPTEDTVKSTKARIDKAKAKAMRSGDIDALQEWIEVGGFLDHLK